jgi:hypothetical protein
MVSCPEAGITYSKFAPSQTNQAQNVLAWIGGHDNQNTLILDVNSKLDNVTFEQTSENFERGIDSLGQMLGFKTQRPDKEFKKGPDNLWQLGSNSYWVIECKNKVIGDRCISRHEAGQMNTSIEWFKSNYENDTYVAVMIHPADCLMDDAYCSEPLRVIQSGNLGRLKQNVVDFYRSLGQYSFNDLTVDIIAEQLRSNSLEKSQLLTYTTRVAR